MKRTITALATLTAALAICAAAVGCTQAQAEPREADFERVHDLYFAERVPSGATRALEEYEASEAERAEAERVAAEQAAAEQAAWEAEQAYYEEAYYEPTYYDNGDGFMSQGVREHNGTTETWYSSNTAYHHSTAEWTPDDEGYYRTDDGYYVVASSDVPEGTVIETSKGEAKVLDSGCDSGVVDFYTNF